MKVIKPNTISYPDGSFSRGTIGTYFDSTGVLQTAAIDVPRFTYNPATLAFEGLLVEPARTNLFTYSSQFEDAAWTKTNVTIATNASVAPDNTTTAESLVTTVAGGALSQTTAAFTAGSKVTITFFVKKFSSNFIRMDIGGLVSCWFNLLTASPATNTAGSGNVLFNSSSIQKINNNWYRCKVTVNTAVVTTLAIAISATDTDNSTSSVNSSCYLWGAQAEVGSTATSHIVTTATTILRNTDVITGTGLIYTTVTDSTAVYSSGTTYAADALVRYNAVIYQSLQATNVNHQPDISPTWWIELYADNMHAAFDTQTSTISSAITSMTFVVKPGSFDSAALINLETALVEIAVSDDNTKQLVYNSSAGLADNTLQDWYQYFFYDPLVHRTQVVFYNIPPYTEAVVTIRLSGSALSIISVAQAIFGTIASLGGTQYGAQAGIVDYSRKDTDEFGTTTFTKRAFSKRLTADIYINNSELNRVQNYLYNIRATPTVWIASDDPQLEEVSIIWGFYRDFSTTISYPSNSLCNLQIEGLT